MPDRAGGPGTPAPAAPWWLQFRWQAASLATLVLLAYWNSLGASFHFDDWALLSDPFVAGHGLGLGVFRLAQTRPLTYWTFHLNFLAGGSEPFGYHLVSVFVHALNGVLVLWLARRHLPALPAFLAAGVFAVHPIQTEAVAYVFSRASLLAACFALFSVLLFVQRRLLASVACFAASLLAKEETAALPAFLFLYDYFLLSGRQWREVARRTWYYAALLVLVAAAAAKLFYALSTVRAPGVGFHVAGVPVAAYALTQARVVWQYLRLLILPYGQNLDYDFPFSSSLIQPPATLAAVLGLALVIGTLAVLDWRGRPWALFALGFFILLAPSSSIVPQSDPIYEHRVYFPMTAMAIAIGWVAAGLLKRLPAAGVRAAAAVACLLAVFFTMTVARNRVWASELSLWSDVVSKSPDKPRPYIGLWRGYAQANRPQDARRALEQGLKLKADDPELNMNLGVLHLQEGRPGEAYAHFNRIIEAGKQSPETWTNLGVALFQMRQTEAAIEAYHRALNQDACQYNARRDLMVALSSMGRNREAADAAMLPAGCRLLPEQARDLERYREQLLRP